MNASISVKPHHFIDIITALGAGSVPREPHPYGHALHTVARRILDGPFVGLKIELAADDICGPCRHNVGGVCDDTIDTSFRPTAPESKQAWNLLIDRRWCERLGIAQGDAFTARQLCVRIRDSMGDITDIYWETPSDRTRERQVALEKGIRVFLDL